LQRLVPHVGRSVAALAEEWCAMAAAGGSGEVEVDVAEWFQAVTEEAITRATFGRSYDDGRAVFAMQGRLMAFASEAFRKVLVPGYRCALAAPPPPPAPLIIYLRTRLTKKMRCSLSVLAGSCRPGRTGNRGSWTGRYGGA